MKEFKNYQEFMEYVEKLDTKKPFDCLDLVVLPEEVRYKDESKYTGYAEGTLFCTEPVHEDGSYTNLCRLDLSFNDTGDLEARCAYSKRKGIITFSDITIKSETDDSPELILYKEGET